MRDVTLGNFIAMTNGTHNAGEIILNKSGKLDIINNHVHFKGRNNQTEGLDSASVLELKKKFLVSLMSGGGIKLDDLSAIKSRLGIDTSFNVVDEKLAFKPLTRAEVRGILEEYKGAINEKMHGNAIKERKFTISEKGLSTNQATLARRQEESARMACEIYNKGFSLPNGVKLMDGVWDNDNSKLTLEYFLLKSDGTRPKEVVIADAVKAHVELSVRFGKKNEFSAHFARIVEDGLKGIGRVSSAEEFFVKFSDFLEKNQEALRESMNRKAEKLVLATARSEASEEQQALWNDLKEFGAKNRLRQNMDKEKGQAMFIKEGREMIQQHEKKRLQKIDV